MLNNGEAIKTLCAADLDGKHIAPREWLVDGIIPHPNVTLLSGDGGTGKSGLSLQLGAAMAARQQWLGFNVMQGPFLYLGAEDEREEIERRIGIMRKALGVSWGDLADLHYRSLAGEDALVGSFDKEAQVMRPTELCHKIEARIRDLGAVACVLDTLADVYGGDEVNRVQVRQFIGLLRGVCFRNKVSIIVLSHPSLSGMSSGSGTSGSTHWHNGVRSRLYFTVDGEARVLEFKKSNYGPKGRPLRLVYRNGVFVPDDGTAPLVSAELKFLQLLDLYNAQERHVSASRSSMYAPTIFSRDPMCKDFSMNILQDAMNSLFTKQQITVETFGPPSKQRKRIIRK